ncbi:MAG: phosphotransferase family protein [Pseudomonadota bacterium]
MSDRLQQVGNAIAAYMGELWQTTCSLQHIEQIPGGASRETYLVQLQQEGDPVGIVLRRDPPSSLIDTERALEYRTYAAVYNHGVVPVPEPITLAETNLGELERPFSVMALVPDGQASPANLEMPDMEPVLATLGQRKWHLLGQLASTPISDLGVEDFMARPEHPAAAALAYWEEVIEADAQHPQPIAAAALRWLHANLPAPPEQLCLVHGDYRTGNFLYTAAGDITAVLDWEMAHIGDPLEDLAWSLDPLWSNQPDLAGRLLPRAEAMQIWEASSGLKIDREAFRWWQIFASLKGLAIWISSAEDYLHGTTKEPILAMAGWPMIDRQNRILLDRLSPLSTHEHAPPLA